MESFSVYFYFTGFKASYFWKYIGVPTEKRGFHTLRNQMSELGLLLLLERLL